ncbi:unnamed protein product [Orchesella dallaii]|uniref:Uncharacterized protein n=1 Tax=Orchesella dallaii TaxID=48710 RepID=A0ABP1RIC4_9HEXA
MSSPIEHSDAAIQKSVNNLVGTFKKCSFAFYLEVSKTNAIGNYFESLSYFLNLYGASAVLTKLSNYSGDQSSIVGLKSAKDIFGQCSIVIYPKARLNGLTDEQDAVFKQKRKPIFVMFVIATEENDKEGPGNYYNSVIKQINFPVIFLEGINFQTISIICATCARTITPISIISKNEVITVSVLETRWNQLHKNFNKQFIVVLQRWNFTEYSSCMAFSTSEIGEDKCTLLVLMDKLNFTIEFAGDSSSNVRESYDYIGDLYPIFPLMTTNLRDFSPQNYDWLSYGVKFSPYSFITIVDHKNIPHPFHSLMQPLDYSTRILIVISNLTILVGFTFFSGANSLKHFRDISFALLALILEQPAKKIFARKDNLSRPRELLKFVLLSSWLFATWQIVGLYKSSIFSYLSVKTNPTSPNSLNQLIQSKISILTWTSLREFSDTGNVIRRFSTLRDTVVAEMLNNSENQLTSEFSKKLMYLHQNVDWDDSPINDFLLHRVLNENMSGIKKTFAFFDKKEHVETLQIMIAVFSENWASKIVLVPIFMDRLFWIVPKNIFGAPFTKYLSRVSESAGRTGSKLLLEN